jgi:hypothetical protein
VARPFLERRSKGLGGKEEIAAAIAAKLIQQQLAKNKSAQPARPSGSGGSAWKMAMRCGKARGW